MKLHKTIFLFVDTKKNFAARALGVWPRLNFFLAAAFTSAPGLNKSRPVNSSVCLPNIFRNRKLLFSSLSVRPRTWRLVEGLLFDFWLTFLKEMSPLPTFRRDSKTGMFPKSSQYITYALTKAISKNPQKSLCHHFLVWQHCITI